MQQIAEWLEKLGMPEYIQRFTDNDIDFTILSDLTDQDLEKIGIASLGHRRKLLRAIADLETIEKSTPTVDVVVAPAAPLPLDTAERRQVTVMFSDLVGSTALSTHMDLEDLREVIAGYQACVAQTVHRFDGFVAKYMGDGVLVYFGYPQAHEDDAERAVRAGLELIEAITVIAAPASLQTRVFEHIGTEPHTRLRYFCSPHYQDSALYPFIVQLERAENSASSGRCYHRACETTTISRC